MPCPDFEMHYPDHANPEISCLPSRQPTIESYVEADQNLMIDEMGDGRTLRFSERGDSFEDLYYRFTGLSEADRDEFEAFFAYAPGEELELIDNTMEDEAFVVVVPLRESLRRRWRYEGRRKWGLDLAFRKLRDSGVS